MNCRKFILPLLFALMTLLYSGALEDARNEIGVERREREERIASLRRQIAEAHKSELQQQERLREVRSKVKEAENEVKNAAAEQERLARYLQAAGNDSAGIGTAGRAVPAGSDCTAVDASGIVLAGRLVRLGNMSYFNSGEQYGFLRDGEDGGLPRFVAALPEDAAALKELFAGGRPEAMPMDFSGEWNFQPEAEATAGRGSLWEHFAAGGLVMLPILLCAWLTLWMLLRRIFSWMRNPVSKISDAYAAGLAKAAVNGNLEDKQFREAEEQAQKLLAESSRGQGVLAACAGVSPLLGLLGTVTGMISTFTALGGDGAASALADGIAEALVTTEAGLLVAIPAVLLHAWGRRRNAKLAAALENQLRRYE